MKPACVELTSALPIWLTPGLFPLPTLSSSSPSRNVYMPWVISKSHNHLKCHLFHRDTHFPKTIKRGQVKQKEMKLLQHNENKRENVHMQVLQKVHGEIKLKVYFAKIKDLKSFSIFSMHNSSMSSLKIKAGTLHCQDSRLCLPYKRTFPILVNLVLTTASHVTNCAILHGNLILVGVFTFYFSLHFILP